MNGVSPTFSVMFEELLENNHDKANIRIRGNVYYIEILNGVDIYRVYDRVFKELNSSDSEID